MVSAAWVAGRLSPYGRWVKTAAVAAAAAGMVSTGALVEHWRMGRKLAQQAEANTQQRLREVTQLTAEQQDREAKNAAAILAAHSALKAQRAINATLAAQLATLAPKGPEFACRQLPLPEEYLEEFRK